MVRRGGESAVAWAVARDVAWDGVVVEVRGFEPLTFWLPSKRSPS